MQDNSTKGKIDMFLPFLLSMMVLGGMLVGGKMQDKTPATQIVFESKESQAATIGQGRVEELIRYIEAKYVDDVASEQLVEKAITALFQDLDPHSVYMSAEQVKKANQQLEGSFVGIGIEYLMINDTITVLAVLEGGPAAIAGMKMGDRIVGIYDESTEQVDTSSDLIAKLKGKAESDVEVSVLRKGEVNPLRILLTRDRITVNSVDVHYMLNDLTGFIKLNKFSSNTFNEFMEALKELKDNHQMENLVLDLRQNGGGYLHEAIKILNQIFSEKDRQLVYTIGKNVKREDFLSAGRNIFDIEKVIILIDENSASASEIVAGAIQDWDKGLIVGRRSYGKGLVQEQYDLNDGSALRLTVARYYTPAGRLIQRDYAQKGEYNDYIQDRIASGEMTNKDQVAVPDTSKFYTANGREVFAGGGITPDIYVPYDSLLLDTLYTRLLGETSKFAFQCFDKQPIKVQADDFIDNYEISETDLLDFFQKNQVHANKGLGLNKSIKNALRTSIKANMAKFLYGNTAYYKVLNNDDPILQEALLAQKSYKALTARK